MKTTLALGGAIPLLAILLVHSAQPPAAIGPATEKRFPPLKVPPAFKATLFACDPLIEYPSVIAIGPKPGAIFVAIDYMTGLGTDGKVKSEVRLVEDTDGDGYADRATVVAKGLNSIQGLAYHDGVLYVMHAPFLSAIRVPSPPAPLPKGEGRMDLLTGLGLAPEQNPVRLHCANGVTVGHDGWLYLAMGDNGVNVLRPEGDRLVHNGGCILRCRYDGRDLHVFSTGLRNIYDIALDAELNVFTRDNENDGGTYMIRVCHCFHGSDHGYPYLYEDRQDEAMPPIGDFGRGSSAGGVCYLETQFPPEYRGNLFFCEWGKSIVRYGLKRRGSGFGPVKEIEFAAGDEKDTYPFKPTDILVQRDGTMMVSDYADGQRPKRGRGRIYHIAYVGKDSPPTKGLGLNSSSYCERWEAQKAIERSGDAFGRATPHGRMHFVWATARSKHLKINDAILDMADEARQDMGVRVQAIRAVADLADPVLVHHKLDAGRGNAKFAKRLANLENARDPRLLMEIIIALGRLRWADAPAWLAANLKNPDAPMAHAIQQTLRRADNWPEVVKLLDEPEPLRSIARRALTDQYEPVIVGGLIARLERDKDADHRREYAETLARVYKKPGPWKYWGYRPGPKPANTEAWDASEIIAKALDRTLGDPDLAVRASTLRRMQREKVPVRVATLGKWLRRDYDADRVGVILTSLVDAPGKDARPFLQEVVLDRKHSAANRLLALDSHLKAAEGGSWLDLLTFAKGVEDGPILADILRRLGKQPKGAPPGLFTGKLGSADPDTRAAAIEALAQTRGPVTDKDLKKLLQDSDVRVRRAAAAAVGKLAATSAIERLLELMRDPDAGVRRGSLDSLRLLKEPRGLPLAATALKDREVDLTALAYLGAVGNADQTNEVVALAKYNPSGDVLAAIVGVLSQWTNRTATTLAQQQDLRRAIAQVQGTGGSLVHWKTVGPLAPAVAARLVDDTGNVKARPDWRTLVATGSESRLLLARTAAGDNVWLATTEVAVPDSTAIEFLASSTGSLQVWLNGKSVFQRESPRKFQIDSDRFVGKLARGSNLVIVQTTAPSGPVEFHLRFRRKSAKAEHEKLTQAALARNGNIERGQKLFLDKEKSLCLKCHQVGNLGERIGPDLTGVGGRFSRIHIVESILDPGRTIAPSYGTFTASLKNGKTISGIKVAESDKTLTLADNQGVKQVIARNDIEELVVSPVSTMPDGLEKRFTEDEFVDLIAFLMAQKSALR